jgi:hypothetical protein
MPLAASAQQRERVRRIGVLMPSDEDEPEGKRRVSAFTQALADLGWAVGRNLRIDLRWGCADINRIRALAQELVGLQPDIILASSTPPTVALQRETRTIPIVFVQVSDPVVTKLLIHRQGVVQLLVLTAGFPCGTRFHTGTIRRSIELLCREPNFTENYHGTSNCPSEPQLHLQRGHSWNRCVWR